jgi:DNA-binding GntR family transcriptional regulator
VALSEQKAYDTIRSSIASGDYPGGTHLRAADLGAQIGVSRTPVREALRRLHAEGLVEIHVHRGAFVIDITPDDIDEVFDLRSVLESHAAYLAARRLQPGDIDRLGAATDRMEACVAGAARDLAGLTRANDEFHRTIIAAAANRRLAAMTAGVVQISWVARTFSIYSDGDLARSVSHHREMIEAFRIGDADWAASVMRSHVRAAYHVFKPSIATSQAARPDGACPGERPGGRPGACPGAARSQTSPTPPDPSKGNDL